MTPIPGFADNLRRRSIVGLVLAIRKVAGRVSGPASGVETKQCAVELQPIGQVSRCSILSKSSVVR